MPFEVFTQKMVPLARVPSVTIQKRGLMSMNRSAYALLGEPSAVELLYDSEAKVVGLRGVEESVPHAYPVRPQSRNHETGPLLVAATAFAQYYGLDTTVSKRWVPEMKDGILCIDLKEPGAIVKGNRTRSSASDDT
ncbi:hypothetical protein [Amycolatopsis sp. cmx-4-68]|uniref:hypothetical protein n=1 Tax=Amycolatopsis sp. cmx-4-68 TaxID=2790938 RepID=UPI00397A68DA